MVKPVEYYHIIIRNLSWCVYFSGCEDPEMYFFYNRKYCSTLWVMFCTLGQVFYTFKSFTNTFWIINGLKHCRFIVYQIVQFTIYKCRPIQTVYFLLQIVLVLKFSMFINGKTFWFYSHIIVRDRIKGCATVTKM